MNLAFTKTASAKAYVYSVYAKKNTRDHIRLELFGTSSSNGVMADYDLADGSIHTAISVSGNFTIGFARILLGLDDDWFRCVLTCITNTDTDLNVRTFLHDGSGVSYSGDGLSSVFLWEASLEQQNFEHPTS